MKKLRITGI